jgi:hypothetical protein
MIVTIRGLNELSQERREREYTILADRAMRLYRNGSVPSISDGILAVLGSVRLSATTADIEQIELRASSLR